MLIFFLFSDAFLCCYIWLFPLCNSIMTSLFSFNLYSSFSFLDHFSLSTSYTRLYFFYFLPFFLCIFVCCLFAISFFSPFLRSVFALTFFRFLIFFISIFLFLLFPYHIAFPVQSCFVLISFSFPLCYF